MMKNSILPWVSVTVVAVLSLVSCSSKEAPGNHFWKGADVSWLTEMESRGASFSFPEGRPSECLSLLSAYGIDAVRLRVWVDPSAHGGWCDTKDLVIKAKRAADLGMAVMVDFHYSDFWADPNKQNIPASWSGKSYDEVRSLLSSHTVDVLNELKRVGVTPLWVQVGNETSSGMLWSVKGNYWGDPIPDEDGNITILESMGHLDRNPSQYAGFVKAGYDAVKSVFPDAQVIVHLDNGFDRDLYDRNLDTLRKYGAKWDITGMSVYPYWAEQSGKETDPVRCIERSLDNIDYIYSKYGTPVVVAETGFVVDESHPEVMEEGRDLLFKLIDGARSLEGKCLGVFYWEPECSPSTYRLGAFDSKGSPTVIMDAFTQ